MILSPAPFAIVVKTPWNTLLTAGGVRTFLHIFEFLAILCWSFFALRLPALKLATCAPKSKSFPFLSRSERRSSTILLLPFPLTLASCSGLPFHCEPLLVTVTSSCERCPIARSSCEHADPCDAKRARPCCVGAGLRMRSKKGACKKNNIYIERERCVDTVPCIGARL